ncbi:MAG: serine/threonine protein kinase [Acidobacteria bacterium]|nr:serine/threonine protein kinase [Acidobacteriota bacterium]MBK8148299.1 serine/threonine protein kinase [Acidobacteriota bacterium]MBK8813421.1 serine/threonine protein kinase [Acidobacteriota bacterium]
MFDAGQRIGNYTLLRKLGRGGFGEVWLAQKETQFVTKKVAVKFPLQETVDLTAIKREAEVWELASGHPNVLPIIDADIVDGQVLIVSEYADGGSLSDKIASEGRLPVRRSLEITIDVLKGLEFLHGRQIVHRDIKPANILLQGETPRLTDFGISRVMNLNSQSSTVFGTDAYMAPEAFDGVRNERTDIWAVGIVFYILLSGRLPFPQDHPTERLFAILTKPFEPLPADVPYGPRAIMAKALAKDPALRYSSAAEMRRDLEDAMRSISEPDRTLAFNPGVRISAPQSMEGATIPTPHGVTPVLPDPEVQTVVSFRTNPVNEQRTEVRTVISRTDQPAYVPAPTQVSPSSDAVPLNIQALPDSVSKVGRSESKAAFMIGASIFVMFIVILAGLFAMTDSNKPKFEDLTGPVDMAVDAEVTSVAAGVKINRIYIESAADRRLATLDFDQYGFVSVAGKSCGAVWKKTDASGCIRSAKRVSGEVNVIATKKVRKDHAIAFFEVLRDAGISKINLIAEER